MFFVPTINHTPFSRFDQVEGLTNAGGKMPIRSPPVDFPSQATGASWVIAASPTPAKWRRVWPCAATIAAVSPLGSSWMPCADAEMTPMLTNVTSRARRRDLKRKLGLQLSLSCFLYVFCMIWVCEWNFSFCFVVLHETGRIVHGDALFSKSPHLLFSRHPCPWLWASPHEGVGLGDGSEMTSQISWCDGRWWPCWRKPAKKIRRVALDVGENSLAVCKELEGIQLEHVGTSK